MKSSRRGRVLVVLHDPLLNGATIAVLRTVPRLEEMGWEFAFWAPKPGPAFDLLAERGHIVSGRPRPIASGLAALREPPGVRVRLAATPPYLRDFARFARSVNPDLVHANSLYSFAEAVTSRTLGLPTTLHLHDMAPMSWKAPLVRGICRFGAHSCFAVSHACASSYSSAGWSPTVIPGAAPVPGEPAILRRDPRPFVVGTVGVLSKRKGSDLFVEAAERAQGSGGAIEFRMVGSATDPLDREWARDVLKRAHRAGIKYLDHADVEQQMRGWDAFVLPSRRDPFPLVMLEAMALGLPVIGARVDGIPEQVSDTAGLLVAPESASALAAAISEMSRFSQDRRDAMGSAGRERVTRLFNLDRLVADTDATYRALLAPTR